MASVIREMQQEDRPAVEALYEQVFGSEPLQLWRARFEWQFRENPAVAERPSKMWVAEKSNRVVGFVAAFPARLSIEGAETTILCPCDLMVSPDARGEQLGERLIRSYIDDAGGLANALAYSPSAERLYDKLGYKAVYAERVSLRLIRPARVLRAAAERRYEAATFRNRLVRAAVLVGTPVIAAGVGALNAARGARTPKDVVIEPVTAIGSEFDDLWKAIKAEIPLAFIRDAQTLRWRFDRDPLTRHTMFVARDAHGSLLGYAVACEVNRGGLQIGKIMDLVCPPSLASRVVPALGAALLAHARQTRVDVVTTKGLHPAIQRELRKILYIPMPGDEMPARFLWTSEPARAPLIYDANNWHLSHADGDEDFVP